MSAALRTFEAAIIITPWSGRQKRSLFVSFLQEGSNDLDNLHGSWPLANRQMASSLKFAGYDYKFVMGDGGHNGRHGGAILPDCDALAVARCGVEVVEELMERPGSR